MFTSIISQVMGPGWGDLYQIWMSRSSAAGFNRFHLDSLTGTIKYLKHPIRILKYYTDLFNDRCINAVASAILYDCWMNELYQRFPNFVYLVDNLSSFKVKRQIFFSRPNPIWVDAFFVSFARHKKYLHK